MNREIYSIKQFAPENTVFAPDAFEKWVGKEMRVTAGRRIDLGILIEAEVIEDGKAAILTIEVTK